MSKQIAVNFGLQKWPAQFEQGTWAHFKPCIVHGLPSLTYARKCTGGGACTKSGEQPAELDWRP